MAEQSDFILLGIGAAGVLVVGALAGKQLGDIGGGIGDAFSGAGSAIAEEAQVATAKANDQRRSFWAGISGADSTVSQSNRRANSGGPGDQNPPTGSQIPTGVRVPSQFRMVRGIRVYRSATPTARPQYVAPTGETTVTTAKRDGVPIFTSPNTGKAVGAATRRASQSVGSNIVVGLTGRRPDYFRSQFDRILGR